MKAYSGTFLSNPVYKLYSNISVHLIPQYKVRFHTLNTVVELMVFFLLLCALFEDFMW